jgi:hypothetical protein
MKGKGKPKMAMKGNKPTMKPMPRKTAKDDMPSRGKSRAGMMRRLEGKEL